MYKKNSPFHRIRVYENGPIRTLRLGEGPNAGKQSQIDLRDIDRHLLEYTRLSFAGLLFNETPSNILIIGLGGGIIPRELRYHYPDAKITIVEIDSDILEVAENFFFFKTDRNMEVHISDGRSFVERHAGNLETFFDFILLDAYNSEDIPGHMITKEFFKKVSAILDSEGIVVANILKDQHRLNNLLYTLQSVYAKYYIFECANAKNSVAVCPGPKIPDLDPGTILKRASDLQLRHHFSFDMNQVAERLCPDYRLKGHGMILTDNGPVREII